MRHEGVIVDVVKYYHQNVPAKLHVSVTEVMGMFAMADLGQPKQWEDSPESGTNAIENAARLHVRSSQDLEMLKGLNLELQDDVAIGRLLHLFVADVTKEVAAEEFKFTDESLLKDLDRVVDQLPIKQAFDDHPICLIHGDYNRMNLFAAPEGEVKQEDHVPIVIDWAMARLGYGILDVADYVLHSNITDPIIIAGWLKAYAEASFLDSEQLITYFPVYSTVKRLHLAAWYMDCALTWLPSERDTYDKLIGELITQAKNDALQFQGL